MTTISTGSLLTDSWNILYDVFTSSLTDTNSAARSGSEFVFSAWPNKLPAGTNVRTGDYNSRQWVKYPIVVLTNEIESGNNLTVGRMKGKTVSFSLEVYNKSMANVDRMVNQAEYILDSIETSLEGSALYNYRMEGTSTGEMIDSGGATIHQKTMTWRYDYTQ